MKQLPLSLTARYAGILAVLCGSILALCAFFFLPYYSVLIIYSHVNSHAITYTGTSSSVTRVQLASRDFPSLSDLAREGGQDNGFLTIANAFPGEDLRFLWLEPLVALFAFLLAGFLLFQSRKREIISGTGLLIAISVLALVALLSRYYSDTNHGLFGFEFISRASYTWGFWVYLVGIFFVAAGTIVVARSRVVIPAGAKEQADA